MRRNTKAFTLIELLTVVFIISLLIGILLPSLNRARIQAKVATVRSLFSTIETGMEMFRNDFGQYPYSIAGYMQNTLTGTSPAESYDVNDQSVNPPTDNGSIPCKVAQGAHLLADAMTGRDTLGYDPSTTITGGARVRWNNNNPRTGPYVKLDARSSDTVFTDSLENRLGEIEFDSALQGETKAMKALRFIVDGFGSPILYYRANPNSRPNQEAHAIYGFGASALATAVDNAVFTHDTVAAGSGNPAAGQDRHFLYEGLGRSGQEYPDPGFYDYIQDKQGSEATGWDPEASGQGGGIRRPYNPESYLLISTGPDRIWGLPPRGQDDDVTNFARPK